MAVLLEESNSDILFLLQSSPLLVLLKKVTDTLFLLQSNPLLVLFKKVTLIHCFFLQILCLCY